MSNFIKACIDNKHYAKKDTLGYLIEGVEILHYFKYYKVLLTKLLGYDIETADDNTRIIKNISVEYIKSYNFTVKFDNLFLLKSDEHFKKYADRYTANLKVENVMRVDYTPTSLVILIETDYPMRILITFDIENIRNAARILLQRTEHFIHDFLEAIFDRKELKDFLIMRDAIIYLNHLTKYG